MVARISIFMDMLVPMQKPMRKRTILILFQLQNSTENKSEITEEEVLYVLSEMRKTK